MGRDSLRKTNGIISILPESALERLSGSALKTLSAVPFVLPSLAKVDNARASDPESLPLLHKDHRLQILAAPFRRQLQR